MPRSSVLDEAENLHIFAEMYAAGESRPDLAAFFGVHPDSITRWSKRADVQALVAEFNRQRSNRILRRIDSLIEKRIENADNLDLKDLLAIRKEMVPQRMEIGRAGEFDSAAEAAAWSALDAGDTPLELSAGDEEGEAEELD